MKNKSLTHLNISLCGLDPACLKEVCSAMRGNTTLASLDLTGNVFDMQSAITLGTLVFSCAITICLCAAARYILCAVSLGHLCAVLGTFVYSPWYIFVQSLVCLCAVTLGMLVCSPWYIYVQSLVYLCAVIRPTTIPKFTCVLIVLCFKVTLG